MQSTTNVFQGGLTTDLHPLVTANTQLTDALNATFITYNGNEMMLQNDMGNTLIQDSTTGSIMGLKDGFIPVGIREHGGIMYIASYNPNTQESELGSIPSPVFNYTYNFDGSPLLSINKSLFPDNITQTHPIKITNERFSVGDVFYCALDITEGNSAITREFRNTKNDSAIYPITFPSISSGAGGYGLVSLHLLAHCDQINKEVDLGVHLQDYDCDKEHRWYYRWDYNKSSEYLEDDVEVDIEKKFRDGEVISYPNFQTGTLSIKPVLETPSDFEILTNQTSMRPEPYFILKEVQNIVFTSENISEKNIRILNQVMQPTDTLSIELVDGCSMEVTIQSILGYSIRVTDASSGNKWEKVKPSLWKVTIEKSAHYIITEDIANKTISISTNQTE